MAESGNKNSFDFSEVQYHFSNFKLDIVPRIQLARRNSEYLKILFSPWKQHRQNIIVKLHSLIDAVNNFSVEQTNEVLLKRSAELQDDLVEDIEMIREQTSIFDQYLENALAIKISAEYVIFGDLPKQIIRILRANYESYFCTLKLSEVQRCETIQDVITLLRLVAELTDTMGGGLNVFETAAESFEFLALHWDILHELSILTDNKGPIMDVREIPDRFTTSSTLKEEAPCYYDLTSNVSVCSYAIAVLGTFLSMNKVETISQKLELLKKLQSLATALTNRLHRMDGIAELLITET